MAGFLMGIIFGGVVYGFLHGIEDKILENQLTFEAERFLEHFAENPTTPLPQTATMQGFLGLQAAPQEIRDWAGDLKPGIHEDSEADIHIYIASLPQRQDLFYLLYRVDAIEPLEYVSLREMTVLGFLMVTLFGGLFGYVIANRMIAPVMRLSRMVAHTSPEDTSLPLEGHFYNDEVGQLAKNFQASLDRVAAFVARERRFTRDASHEFRTPVTVIKGAAELLARRIEEGPNSKALSRIQRAVRDLENIIETFLYLGRQGSTFDHGQSCTLLPVVEDSLEQNRYLLEGKQVAVHLEPGPNFEVATPRAVVAIAIGNLIRNSFQYTEQGSVRLSFEPFLFQIADTGRGIAENDLCQITRRETRATSGEGFGLGLSIVNDFCASYGWDLDIQSELGKGTVVRLHFAQGTQRP